MSGLSRGLGSLIPQTGSLTSQVLPKTKEGLEEIDVTLIKENPYQPRTHFSASELEDLTLSIKEHGIMVPLVVTRLGSGYELIAGERRLRAARNLGMKTVPAIIRDASEQQKLELALIENIQRQDLGALEEATAYKALTDEFNLTQAQVSARVGKSRSEVANTIRLLDLPLDMQTALREGRLMRSHARTLLAERDPVKRQALFEAILTGTMTVRDVELKISSSVSALTRRAKNPNLAAHEKALREALGTRVDIQERGGKGKITLSFYSKQELLDLIHRLSGL